MRELGWIYLINDFLLGKDVFFEIIACLEAGSSHTLNGQLEHR